MSYYYYYYFAINFWCRKLQSFIRSIVRRQFSLDEYGAFERSIKLRRNPKSIVAYLLHQTLGNHHRLHGILSVQFSTIQLLIIA